METNDFNRNKGPYHGIWLVVLLMIAIPLLTTLFFKGVLQEYENPEMVLVEAQCFAGMISVCFCVIVMIKGILTDAFVVVVKRLREFVDSLIYEDAKHAFKWYFQNAKEKGYCFWIYLALIIFNFYYLIDGISKFLIIANI